MSTEPGMAVAFELAAAHPPARTTFGQRANPARAGDAKPTDPH